MQGAARRDSASSKRKATAIPIQNTHVLFSEDQVGTTSQQKRRVLTRVWLALLVANIVLLVIISAWAVHRSHKREQQDLGTCFQGPLYPEDRRRDKTKLSIVNFNAEWLFMRGGRGNIRCPSESCPWASKSEATEHLRRVAAVLAELDADIVNLNEVEDCKVLGDLLNMLPTGHGYKLYLAQGHDVATGQNPALLSRVDPVSNLRHSTNRVDFPVPGSRCRDSMVGSTGCTKHYVTRFELESSKGSKVGLVMAGVHLLAKPLDQQRCARREAQAMIIAQLVAESKKPGDKVIVAGDFNDFDNEAIGPSGERSISRTVEIVKSALGLKNPASLVPQQLRYSCWFDRDQNCADGGADEHTLIDHVLVSKDWEVRDARFYHGYSVSCRDRISDHWPFKLVLDV